MIIVLALITIALLIYFIVNHKLSEKKKYEDKVYLDYLQQIAEFNELINSFDDYITWVFRDKIKARYRSVNQFFRNKEKYYKKEEKISGFNAVYNDFDSYISAYNKRYVNTQMELLSEYFDDIEGKKLDNQQRRAVITDEYSNLIIAGAGSGKTLTILAKVKYLIDKKNINPKDILLLSFTKKTVEELNVRLMEAGINSMATTFHKLGYDTIKKVEPSVPAVTNDSTLNNVIKEYLQNDIFENTKAVEAFIQYVACFMNIPEEVDNFNSLGEKIDTEKGIDFYTLKSKNELLNKVSKLSLDSIQGEKVKSVEELTIANFLYLNGVEYEYEKPYPHGEIMYRPDFYLKEYDIWLEHFGVDENNCAKWLTPFNEKKYVDEMAIKRQTHIDNNTRLLETYSYYNRDNVLLQKLREMLENEHVKFKPRDSKSIYQKVAENDDKFGKEIIKLIESYINLSKSRQLNSSMLSHLYQDRKNVESDFILERQKLFLQFVLPILEKYNTTLKHRNEIDFNDMINLATDIIKANKFDYSYNYIVIDEYQDISSSRFYLIKEIRELSKARLICVGDDWQSIYRFAGSDISLFSNFEKHVGKHEKLFIEQTYRNSQSLIDITSKFIQKNTKQIQKSPVSKKEPIEEPVKFVYYEQYSLENIFINELQRIVEKYGNKSVLVLGRHSFDINDLIKLTPNNRIKYIEFKDKLEIDGFEDVDIKYITVHKSKGLEADNVIILNVRNDLLGFPNKMTDDPILSLMLSDQDDYRFAEERRLFYVALTRTKNEVVLMIPSETSLFVDELLADNHYLLSSTDGKLKTTNCPYCQTGKLMIRQNSEKSSRFLGCSHYPICNQTFNQIEILEKTILCPKCASGFMVKRNGKFGDFLGCTNYPKCKETIDLD